MPEIVPQATEIKHSATTKKEQNLEWVTNDMSNLLTEAFRQGEIKGTKDVYKKFESKYRKDLIVAKNLFENYFIALSKDNIKCHSIHLRVKSYECFEAIFVIPQKDYFSESFAKAVALTSKFTDPSETIHLNYRFMPYSKRINYEVLESDGFLMSYGK
jgi:hypothetical protein